MLDIIHHSGLFNLIILAKIVIYDWPPAPASQYTINLWNLQSEEGVCELSK